MDTERSISVLTSITGKPVLGFRAPSFSVTRKTLWALDILKESGLSYDSSVYPTRHPDYGIPDFGRAPRRISGLWELPMTSISLAGLQLPISGGGYFRLFPYEITRRLLKRAARSGPVVLYFHPWEFDEGQPRVALPHLRRFRHYVGLAANREKFRRLLDDFPFTTMQDYLAPLLEQKGSRC
jgi:polysaccharide deacetylase family protein (PEP-CTERM system associated)